MFIFKFYKNLLINNWPWIKKVLWWALIWLIIGAITPLFFPDFTQKVLKMITNFFQNLLPPGEGEVSHIQTVWIIFKQNFKAALVALSLGIILGIIPYFIVMVNSFVVGLFFTSIFKKSVLAALFFILALVPHGIIEIPALILAVAFGVRLGLFWRIKEQKLSLKQKFVLALKQNLQIIPLIFVMLIIAAFLEVYVSGQLVEIFGGSVKNALM